MIFKRFLQCGIVLLFWIWCGPLQLAGQGYSYVNYNTKEGLAGSVVYCMVQDLDGFIWFGTETGLSRFDGTRFRNFTMADGLPDNEIIKLFVDSKNRIWITPFQNKVCYFHNGRLYTDANDSMLRRLAFSGGITGVTENKKQEIAIVQSDGITILKPDGSTVAVKPPRGSMNINQVGLDFDGSFLFNVVTETYDRHTLYRVTGDTMVLSVNFDEFVVEVSTGIYLADDLRILYRNPASLVFFTPKSRYELPAPRNMINIVRLNDTMVAVSSLKETEIINLKERRKEFSFHEHEHVSSVLQDSEGNFWFSTMGKGVFRLPSTKFNAAILNLGSNSLPVHSINKANGSILIGTDNFLLWKLNLQDKQLTRREIYNSYSYGRILVLEPIGRNNLLLGTDRGLVYIDGHQAKGRRDMQESFSAKSFIVVNDTIFVGHNSAADLFDFTSLKRIKTFFPYRTTAIHKRNDSVFLGTLKGLHVKSGSLWYDHRVPATMLLPGRISGIKETDDGIIWVATYGNGVSRLKDGRFLTLNEDSGLTSNIVRTIYVDKRVLWVGTDKGLNKVEPVNGSYKITRYTSADGIISDMINAVYVDSNTVYVGTPAGLTWFREDEVFTNSMCVLKLTGIRSDRQSSIGDTSKIQFEHFDHDIRFEYTGISFKSAGEITYRYRLIGLDNGWHTTTENFLNYPTLPSGDYVLELQAVNKFGVESNLLRVSFMIQQLLWEKTWFRVLAAILLACITWIFIAWRIRRIRRQEKAKFDNNRKIAELEQMALKAQMNPHFIFNSLNSIQHYMFARDVQGANRYITEFSRLIRLTMDFSSKPWISLENEIRFLSTYLELEMKRFEGKFKYHISAGDNVDVQNCFIPPMILQPYIENSIRHGIRYRPDNEGMVTVSFDIHDNYLQVKVQDNGIGRLRSMQLKGDNNIEYQSKGMALTSRRIEMMNKISKFPIFVDIDDIYEEDQVAGTRVVIRIPVSELIKPSFL